MSILKSHLISYFGFGVLNKAIPFLAALLLARWMSPADFGKAGVFVSLVAILALLANFSVSQQIVRGRELLPRDEFLYLVGTSRYFSLSVLVIVLFLALVFLEGLEEFLSLNNWIVIIAIILAFFRAAGDFMEKLLVLERRSKELGVVQSSGALVAAFCSVAFVFFVADEDELYARIAGICFGVLVCLVFGYFSCLKLGYSFRRVSLSAYVNILVYGVRVLPQLFSNWVKMGADRVILASVLAADNMGGYVFLMTLVSIYSVFGNAVNNVYLPESMALYNGKRSDRLILIRRKYVFLLAVALFVGAAGISGFKWAGFWPEGYMVSYIAIWLAMAALFFQYIYMLYMKVFHYCDWMSKLGCVNLISAVCYVLAIYYLPDNMTVDVACICLLLYNVFMAVFVIIVSRNYEKRVLESFAHLGDVTEKRGSFNN